MWCLYGQQPVRSPQLAGEAWKRIASRVGPLEARVAHPVGQDRSAGLRRTQAVSRPSQAVKTSKAPGNYGKQRSCVLQARRTIPLLTWPTGADERRLLIRGSGVRVPPGAQRAFGQLRSHFCVPSSMQVRLPPQNGGLLVGSRLPERDTFPSARRRGARTAGPGGPRTGGRRRSTSPWGCCGRAAAAPPLRSLPDGSTTTHRCSGSRAAGRSPVGAASRAGCQI